MTFQEFDNLFNAIVESLKTLGKTKGTEYANSEDRFANFKRLALKLDTSSEKILWIYLTKHLDAIESYLKTGKTHSESIHSRIQDALLYLFLLDGIITEKEN